MCSLVLIALAACRQEPQPETTPSPDMPPVSTPSSEPAPDNGGNGEEIMGDDDSHSWIDDDSPELSYSHNEILVAALTPEDAYIHSDIESMLVLMSEKTMDELIAFCLAAVDELDAELIDIDESQAGYWIYNGSLGESLPLHIELRDDGGSVNMMVLY